MVVAGALVAAMFLRRFVRRPRVAGAAVAAMVLLVLALELRSAPEVAAPDVVGVSDLQDEPRLPSSTAVTPVPPAMRRVPIPTTTAGPLAPPGRGRPRPSSGPPPPAPPPQGPPPTSTPPSAVAPIVVPPPVPTTVTVTTAPSDDTTTTP